MFDCVVMIGLLGLVGMAGEGFVMCIDDNCLWIVGLVMNVVYGGVGVMFYDVC